MSVPPGTEMFQFPGFASRTYVFSTGSLLREGFPHSDIRGSKVARTSPRLLAACHVLHRLLAPRHPPNALLITHTPSPPARRTKPRHTPGTPRKHHATSPKPGQPGTTHTQLQHASDRTTQPPRKGQNPHTAGPWPRPITSDSPFERTRHTPHPRGAQRRQSAEGSRGNPTPPPDHLPQDWRLAGSNR